MSSLFKADLHIHTTYSKDSLINIDELVNYSIKIGLSAIAITDHNEIKGAIKALRKYRNENRIIIIPGVELDVKNGHLLAYNILKLPPTERLNRMSIPEVIDYIHAEGGIASIAHPLDPFRPFKNFKLILNLIDAIEIANASDLLIYRNYKRLHKTIHSYEIGFTAGSDAHILDAVGITFLYTTDNLETIDDIIEYILKRKFNVYVRRTPFLIRLKKIILKYLL